MIANINLQIMDETELTEIKQKQNWLIVALAWLML